MEGVCGIVRFDGAPIPADLLGRMARAATHRGKGRSHVGPHAHLAYLSVRPQIGQGLPFTAHNLTVTASARIDNRDELIPLLRAHLDTDQPGDGQLILAGHLKWGSDAPARFIGDYAYVVFDHDCGALFAARDPMGMRPLYYHQAPRRVAFASEIQQLLTVPDVPVDLHEPAVARHLIADFTVLDETFYRGIASLPPGHALSADADGWRTWRFWEVDPAREERYPREQDYAERFREIFLGAVRDRMRDSGPLGIFLSGGVDSTAVASAIGWWRERERDLRPVHAVSWAFDELRQCDERHLSTIVVERYGFATHEIAAEANAPLARYPDHGPHRDEPFLGAFQATIETGLASARELGVTSMWSGDRGDLVSTPFAPPYLALLRHRHWRRLSATLREHAMVSREAVALVVARDLALPGIRALARRFRGRSALQGSQETAAPSWVRDGWLELVGVDATVHQDFSPTPAGLVRDRANRHRLVFVPFVMRAMAWSERTNAAFGLSFLDPFSDRRLAEYVVAVPQAVLNRPPGPPKRIVRAALHGVVPDALRQRATKIVPTPLFDRALRETSSAVVESLITRMEAHGRGFVDEALLQRHYREYRDGGRLHPAFWHALTLEMWLRKHWTP